MYGYRAHVASAADIIENGMDTALYAMSSDTPEYKPSTES